MENVKFQLDFVSNPEDLKETEDRIKGISQATAGAQKSIQQYFDVTKENIAIQKQVISELEAQLKEFDKAIQNAAPGKIKGELMQERANISGELNAEKNALIQLEAEVKKTEVSHETLRTALRKLQEEMARMEMSGKRNTDEYRKIQLEAGKVADAIGDVKKQTRILANDERMFQGVIEGVGGIAGAFSAAQGAVGLFAGENENLQKIMTRVQSLMAITIGLQQIAQVVNKDSAFRVVVLTKAKDMWAATNIKVATTLGITTGAASALMATLTLGLSVAITAIVAGLSVFISKQGEAKKEMQEFNKAVAGSASKPIAAIMKLSAEYRSLGDSMQKKEAFILKNQDAFEKLGFSVQSVYSAENALIRNTAAVVNALVVRAKATGAATIAEKKAEEYALARAEMDATRGRARAIGSAGGADKPYKEAKARAESLEKEMNYFQNLAISFGNEADRLLGQFSDTSEGSIDALKNKLTELNKAYDNATTAAKRNEILVQIKKTQKEIDDLDKRKATKTSKTNDFSQYKDEINKALELYESGIERINFLRNEMTKPSSEEKKSFISDLIDKENTQIKNSIAAFTKSYYNYLDSRTSSVSDYYENLQKIDEAIAIEPDLVNKEFLTKMKETYIKMYELGIDGFDALNQLNEGSIADFGTFEEKKLQIVQKYEKEINAARFVGNEARAKNLETGRDQEITQLLEDTVKSADAIAKLFTGLDQLGDKAKSTMIKNLKFLIDWVEQNKNNENAQWTGAFLIDPAALAELKLSPEILDKLKQTYKELIVETDKPAFTKLMSALDELRKAKQENNIEGAVEASEKIQENLADAAVELVLATDLFAGVMNAFGASGKLTQFVSQATSAYSSIRESGAESFKSISSIVELVIFGLGIIYEEAMQVIDEGNRRLESSISLYQDQVNLLQSLMTSTSFSPTEVLSPTTDSFGYDSYTSTTVSTQYEAFLEYKRNLDLLRASIQQQLNDYREEAGDRLSDAEKAKIAELEAKLRDLGIQIDNANTVYAETFGDWANGMQILSDSIFDAFDRGEDAAQSFTNAVSNMFKSMIKDAFMSSVVAKYLQPIKDYIEWEIADKGADILLDKDWINYFKGLYEGVSDKLLEESKLFEGLLGNDGSPLNALQTAVKGITSEEAGVIAGQFNAMRINGYELNEIVREQLTVMYEIRRHTSFIEKIYNKLNSTSSNNRSKGLS